MALFFVYSAGILLLITAFSKLISSFGSSHILELPDPILAIPFRWIFCFVGIIELVAAGICLFSKKIVFRSSLVALLSTDFALYRIGLWVIGWHRPCPCLGNLTDTLHISPQSADTTMKIILAYLLIGSYAILFWLWLQKRKAVAASAQSDTSPPSSAQ